MERPVRVVSDNRFLHGIYNVNMAAVTGRLWQQKLIERIPWDGVVSRRLVIYQLSQAGFGFLDRFVEMGLKI